MKKQTSPPNRRGGRLVLLCFVLGLILIVMLVERSTYSTCWGASTMWDSGTAPTLSPEELDAYLATQPEELNTLPHGPRGRHLPWTTTPTSAGTATSSTFCSSVRTAGRTRPGRVRIP